MELNSWELSVLLNFQTLVLWLWTHNLLITSSVPTALPKAVKGIPWFKNVYHGFIYGSSYLASAFIPFLMGKPEFWQWDPAALKAFQFLSESLLPLSNAVVSQHHGHYTNLHLHLLSLFTPTTSRVINTLRSMLGSEVDAAALSQPFERSR